MATLDQPQLLDTCDRNNDDGGFALTQWQMIWHYGYGCATPLWPLHHNRLRGRDRQIYKWKKKKN